MDFVFTLFSFIAVCIYSAGIAAATNCKKAFAPLGGVCFTILYYCVCACLNILVPGGYLYFAAAIILLLWLLKTKPISFWKEFLCPSVYFFLIAGLGVMLLFSIRKPLFSTWDEFSLWGTAAKLVKLNNELYTTAEIQWAWTATQKPGLILLGYFFDFFGSHAEWRVAVGYDVLLFACFAAIMEPLKGKARSLAAPAALILFLTPFLFSTYGYSSIPSTVYFSALGDIPMGVLMAACIVIWFGEEHNSLKELIIPIMALFSLVYVRDTAFPLAMICAGIMCLDCIVKTVIDKSKIRFVLAKATVLFVTPIVSFISWSVYLKLVLNVNSFEIGGQDQKNMFSMLLSGVSELFGIGTTEKFKTIMSKMLENFFGLKLTVFGSGIILLILFITICAVFLFCERDKVKRIRYSIASISTLLGFIAFYIFTGFCFVYVLKPIESENLSGYIRYIYPYYIAWFLVLLFFLFKASAHHSKRAIFIGRSFIFILCALFSFSFTKVLTPQTSVINYYDDFLFERQRSVYYSSQIQELEDTKNGNIFFVSQGDNGVRWFTYCCDMLPLQLDYSFGGGTMAAPGALPEDYLYYIPLTKKEFSDYLLDNNCKYVFVERVDDLFVSEYSKLFSDRLEECINGVSMLYKVTAQNDELTLEPIKAMEYL